MEKIVIAGGNGFIGRHLLNELSKENNVYIIDKEVSPYIGIHQRASLERYLERLHPDVIFDLATLPLPLSIREPYSVVYMIYCMGINLCELLREGYYKTLIHISSSEVYNITTPYAAAKDAQDKLIQAYVNCYDLDIRIARPYNNYGPGQDLGAIIPATIKRILQKKPPIIYGDGKQSRDLVYVDDTVKAIIKLWKEGRKGDVKVINTGECYSVNEIVEMISKLMKYKGKPIYKPARTGDTQTIHGEWTIEDNVQIEEGLRRTIEWWKENYTQPTTPD